jgi:predicted  nucleic acid-binding Zn-ribbon protein
MHPDIKLVLDLQHLDQRISGLQKEIAQLPRHVAQIEKALDSHNRRLEADRAALSGNQKERKRLEGEIQVQQQKISKFRDQMLGAKTNEQYRAFQTEIEFCEGEIRKPADRILELMGESDPLDKAVKAAEAALKKEKEQVDAEKKRATDRTDTDKRELDRVTAERKTVSEQMKPPLLKAYQRIRAKWKSNIVAAEANDGRCTACNMSLRPQFFQDLRRGEEVMFCESCGRVLYYHPAVVIDEQGESVGTRAEPESRPLPIRRV